MTDKIDISGVDKGELLAALFNNSRPMGMGVLQAHLGPQVMTKEDAWKVINGSGDDHNRNFPTLGLRKGKTELYFDYLYGRPLKVNLTEDMVDPWGYDRDNGGPGTLESIVNELRK